MRVHGLGFRALVDFRALGDYKGYYNRSRRALMD